MGTKISTFLLKLIKKTHCAEFKTFDENLIEMLFNFFKKLKLTITIKKIQRFKKKIKTFLKMFKIFHNVFL